MKSKMLTTTLLAGLVLASFSCGKSASEQLSQTDDQANNKAAAGTNPAIQDATYASPCTSSTLPDVGPIKFPGTQTFFELSDLVFTKHMVYFTDANCQTPALDIRETGNVHVDGVSAVVAGAIDEDFLYAHTNITLQNDLVITAFNTATVCGLNDWSKGVTRDTSNKSGSGLCPGKASPRKTADVVLVENGNQLFLGAAADQDAATARPTQVNRANGYLKQ